MKSNKSRELECSYTTFAHCPNPISQITCDFEIILPPINWQKHVTKRESFRNLSHIIHFIKLLIDMCTCIYKCTHKYTHKHTITQCILYLVLTLAQSSCSFPVLFPLIGLCPLNTQVRTNLEPCNYAALNSNWFLKAVGGKYHGKKVESILSSA